MTDRHDPPEASGLDLLFELRSAWEPDDRPLEPGCTVWVHKSASLRCQPQRIELCGETAESFTIEQVRLGIDLLAARQVFHRWLSLGGSPLLLEVGMDFHVKATNSSGAPAHFAAKVWGRNLPFDGED